MLVGMSSSSSSSNIEARLLPSVERKVDKRAAVVYNMKNVRNNWQGRRVQARPA